jgi:predicted transcriptional regulator
MMTPHPNSPCSAADVLKVIDTKEYMNIPVGLFTHLIGSDLTPRAMSLWMLGFSKAQYDKHHLKAQLTIKEITSKFHCSEKTAQRLLTELEDNGFIEKIKKTTEQPSQSTDSPHKPNKPSLSDKEKNEMAQLSIKKLKTLLNQKSNPLKKTEKSPITIKNTKNSAMMQALARSIIKRF